MKKEKPIQRRCRIIKIRLTDEEYEKIKKKSEMIPGGNISEYIRRTALNRKITPLADLQLIVQLRKIGVNINQIARYINSHKEISNLDILMYELKKYNSQIAEALREFKLLK